MGNPNDDEREEDSAYDNTRRQFVAGSAGIVGGLAAGSALSGSAVAQEETPEGEDGEGTDDGTDDGEEMESDFEDDVAVLNYALKLEYLEASFYRQGLENISEDEFCNCEALTEESALRERVFGELQTIQAHEEAHVEALTGAIEDLGGTPVEEPEFDFGARVEYPMAFLGTAVLFEDVGVSAYAGAAPAIESEELLTTALGIHSVEARHAAFVRTLMNRTSFPNVVDEARSRMEVLDLVAPFIVGEDGEPGEPPEETETPGEETETPDDGTDTPDDGTETPDDGTDTPTDNGTDTPTDNGTDTPTDNGTDTPTNGTDTPTNGTDTPTGNGTSTPTGNGTSTPTGNGTGTSTNGTDIVGNNS